MIREADYLSNHGVSFGKPAVDNAKAREWKNSVVKKLTGGLQMLAKQRKVSIVQGTAKFTSIIRLKSMAKRVKPRFILIMQSLR